MNDPAEVDGADGNGPVGSGGPVGSAEADGSAEAPAEKPVKRRSRLKRVLLVTGLVVLVLIGGVVTAGSLYLRSVNNKVERVDAFNDIPQESRPSPVAPDAMNMLILGSDSRDPENADGSRSDTMIIAHLPKDRASAQLVSIPRDTWLHIPKSTTTPYGNTNAKINAAFAWGGVPLVVQTVEGYTNLRIDHVIIVDFAGFKEIVDAIGGIDIYVDKAFTSTHSLNPDHKRTFAQGLQTMDGATALDYSRERYAFPDGDFARIRHQQQVIKAILDKAASAGILSNPGKLNALLNATADAVSVDKTLSLLDMAMDLRHLRGDNLTFMTSPSKGVGKVGDQSVIFADEAKAKVLYDALRRDAAAEIPADLKK